MTHSRHLRICICSTFYPPYSSDADGLYVQRLATGLAEKGHDVTVIFNPAAHEILKGHPVDASPKSKTKIEIKHLRSRFGVAGLMALHQSGKPIVFGQTLSDAFNTRFDVIHYYNVSLMGGPGVFAQGEATVKIGGISDHWLICPMHILWKWPGKVCDKPNCIRCCLGSRRPPQIWRSTGLMSRMARHIDLFMAPSIFTIQKHRERGFRHPTVHLPLFYTKPERRASDSDLVSQPYFLCTGRLEQYKGFQTVIPLFRETPELSLIICGEGTYRTELESIAEGMDNVLITEMLDQNQLQILYEHALATIVPSQSYQTFCHVTVESYSAGTPVIAFNRSAVSEIVSEHGGGILYDNVSALAESIRAVAGQPGLRNSLSEQARNAFSDHFSEEVYLQRYLDVITRMIALKRSNHSVGRMYADEYFQGREFFDAD